MGPGAGTWDPGRGHGTRGGDMGPGAGTWDPGRGHGTRGGDMGPGAGTWDPGRGHGTRGGDMGPGAGTWDPGRGHGTRGGDMGPGGTWDPGWGHGTRGGDMGLGTRGGDMGHSPINYAALKGEESRTGGGSVRPCVVGRTVAAHPQRQKPRGHHCTGGGGLCSKAMGVRWRYCGGGRGGVSTPRWTSISFNTHTHTTFRPFATWQPYLRRDASRWGFTPRSEAS
ncbi:hypothetical protein NHX12_020644 [Muraenolepis orangiensis]|uniref:Uncharacterized protein n=1 Tax=Muraenolepis orangiensis TaxID=630683 RepID=A0A9Q0ETU5_9TELE|nr:hypothetical protein NHX12_020644 [Muraenolepis orangiensis]